MINLQQGDCLELMKNIPDKSIDMVLCDLPYQVTACKWDKIIPFDKLWGGYDRIVKDNGAILLFGTEPFSTYLRMSNIKNYRYDWYWEKKHASGFQFSHSQPMRLYENICVFYKQKPYYDYKGEKLDKPVTHALPICKSEVSYVASKNGNKDNRIYKSYDYATKQNRLAFEKDKHAVHPTQKPVKLLEYLIKTYTNEGETVLDNCAGSGSTAIACINTNRNFIGMELDDHYYQIAKERINERLDRK